MMKNISCITEDGNDESQINKNVFKTKTKKQYLTENVKEKDITNRDDYNIKATSRTVYE
jgi:hypothetical protein